MKVNRILYRPIRDDNISENIARFYADHDGLTLIETLSSQSRSDFLDGTKQRVSHDNGKMWSDWETLYHYTDDNLNQGEHQRAYLDGPVVYNPVYRHTVSFRTQQIWVGGYEKATKEYWSGNSADDAFHSFITVKGDDGTQYTEFIRYQSGDDFDPENWAKPSFVYRNYGFVIGNVVVDENGDILFTMEVRMENLCELGGMDINEIFPSMPTFPNGILVMRGKWNGERYVLTPGQPIVISDRLSSRGLNEPTMARLASGRILVIMRASNAVMSWRDRMRLEPGTPGFKWYAYSDDNGETFSEVMPWHFDDGEVIYSSATYSRIIRDVRTGKHYWVGNITDHHVNGNWPRFPLNIVEIDEQYGTAKKKSLTVIDTRREGEPETVQLSNFNLIQNRENGYFEVVLSKYGQIPGNDWCSEVWMYEIDPES